MSNKTWGRLDKTDREIRSAVGAIGPGNEGTLMTIEFIAAFELFNTRPHHNYETWGSGYRVTGMGQTAEMEDLDEAIELWARRVKESRNG